jgi:hypothetical protein
MNSTKLIPEQPVQNPAHRTYHKVAARDGSYYGVPLVQARRIFQKGWNYAKAYYRAHPDQLKPVR